jgi:hypothetical protein
MDTQTKFEFILPEREANKILNDGFYVKINKGWTATVRCLADLIQVLSSGEHEIDPEVFGIITKESNDPNLGNTYGYLIEIIAKYKGFASFNTCKHQFIETTEEMETVSIKTKSGKLITVCVMENAGCIDINMENSVEETVKNGGKDISQFKIMGFNLGQTPVKSTLVTLMTILFKK